MFTISVSVPSVKDVVRPISILKSVDIDGVGFDVESGADGRTVILFSSDNKNTYQLRAVGDSEFEVGHIDSDNKYTVSHEIPDHMYPTIVFVEGKWMFKRTESVHEIQEIPVRCGMQFQGTVCSEDPDLDMSDECGMKEFEVVHVEKFAGVRRLFVRAESATGEGMMFSVASDEGVDGVYELKSITEPRLRIYCGDIKYQM